MWIGTLAFERAMLSLRAMSSVSQGHFDGALSFGVNRIRHSILVCLFASHMCSAVINLSDNSSLVKGSTAVAVMVLPLTETVVHCCTRCIPAHHAAIAAILGRAGVAKCVRVVVSAGAGRNA